MSNQLWCLDFLTPPTPLIIPHWLSAFLESLMPLKNCFKNSLKHSIVFCGIFPRLKQKFIAYRSSSRPDCIFEIHQLWHSGFCKVYSSFCCSCSFEAEIIKIGQSSHNMYRKNREFSRVYDNSKFLSQKVWNLIECTTYFEVSFCLHFLYTNKCNVSVLIYHVLAE